MKVTSKAIIAVLIADLCLCLLIISKVSYTEIDWKAYMQEVEGFLQGERNYLNLKGDTGPLVYPAGFVYIFSLLYWICDHGSNILLGELLIIHQKILLICPDLNRPIHILLHIYRESCCSFCCVL